MYVYFCDIGHSTAKSWEVIDSSKKSYLYILVIVCHTVHRTPRPGQCKNSLQEAPQHSLAFLCDVEHFKACRALGMVEAEKLHIQIASMMELGKQHAPAFSPIYWSHALHMV